MGRQHDFRMDDAALAGVVVDFPVKLVCDFLPRPISGGGNCGFAFAAAWGFLKALFPTVYR